MNKPVVYLLSVVMFVVVSMVVNWLGQAFADVSVEDIQEKPLN